mmetsp:Transcript_63084/g.169111  ORF Transcript_63084/g.169111 Transcript_63084/m.169111 type:complete len:213 (+) Transcript_63084:552-1190(+)
MIARHLCCHPRCHGRRELARVCLERNCPNRPPPQVPNLRIATQTQNDFVVGVRYPLHHLRWPRCVRHLPTALHSDQLLCTQERRAPQHHQSCCHPADPPPGLLPPHAPHCGARYTAGVEFVEACKGGNPQTHLRPPASGWWPAGHCGTLPRPSFQPSAHRGAQPPAFPPAAQPGTCSQRQALSEAQGEAPAPARRRPVHTLVSRVVDCALGY